MVAHHRAWRQTVDHIPDRLDGEIRFSFRGLRWVGRALLRRRRVPAPQDLS
ncbi:hypothetical protein ACFFMN_16415 [Planobispora siamensis]|uniref:Uncharacterized protein n=1 Tax=Planobispora siamensis TaxID=936338 RepID=A0A8J3SIR8_9ACTN|nr:hypothetical protein [Planobispora siamensis]GIH93795.1 hypothetical protein Psi01_44250 [Planobispora siamensis]